MTETPKEWIEACARALCAAHCHSVRAEGDALVFGPGCKCFAWELLIPDARDAITALRPLIEAETREALAACMIRNGVATGHGDTSADLIMELDGHFERERALASALRAEGE